MQKERTDSYASTSSFIVAAAAPPLLSAWHYRNFFQIRALVFSLFSKKNIDKSLTNQTDRASS